MPGSCAASSARNNFRQIVEPAYSGESQARSPTPSSGVGRSRTGGLEQRLRGHAELPAEPHKLVAARDSPPLFEQRDEDTRNDLDAWVSSLIALASGRVFAVEIQE